MADMKLFLELLARSTGLKRELNESGRYVNRFTSGARREFASLRQSMGSLQGKMASIGIAFSGAKILADSARLDKSLTQVTQTAGEGVSRVKELRREFFLMARDTGRDIEGLKSGFDALIQSGQSRRAALESIRAINIAESVTGANPRTLAGGLTVGATVFDLDLEKPGKALELLNKMTVAGRLGNAELENLSDIFASVGVNAASANFSFDRTLAFIEALSMAERQPERLATLARSTLRVFTSLRYMAEAQSSTGVKFFADDGSRRDPIAVLKDIKARWDKLTTDKQRASFIQGAFGKADEDTIKGIRTLLQGDSLGKINQFADKIEGAAGTLERDLPDAINNAVDQAGRLKAVLREAGDRFAQPINKALADLIKLGLDKKKDGGLELGGLQIAGGGGALAAAAYLAARYGNKAIASLASRALAKGSSTAIGVVEGKVIEATTGVTPVFVTNWPAGGTLGIPSQVGGGRTLPPGLIAGGAVGTSLLLGIPISHYLSRAAKDNGWDSATYGPGTPEYDVMGIGYRREPSKNEINVDVHFDELARAFTKVNSTSTEVKVNSGGRGVFFDALTRVEVR